MNPTRSTLPDDSVRFRHAVAGDLPALVGMLADDPLGALRECVSDPLPPSYVAAFEAIQRDANIELIVAESPQGEVVGMLQLTFTPFMTHQGAWRAGIEGVRIARHTRRSGLGQKLMAWAIDRARKRHCHVIQLTTDKGRHDALQFYAKLGFMATHEGMKLELVPHPLD